jgi:single-strand DNA-binding protein
MNKAILIGNLGKDPELTYTQAGTAKCKFSIATSKVRKDAAGEKTETTFWHNIVVWGNQAEACGKYLTKGRKVCVEGEIESRSYDDKDGVKKYITEINAQHVEFLGGDRSDGAAGEQRKPAGSTSRQPAPSGKGLPPSVPQPPLDDDSDIPF